MIALTPIDLYVRKSRTNGIYNHICFILICIYTIYDYTTDIGLASTVRYMIQIILIISLQRHALYMACPTTL